jgi:hypothetical protein
VVEELQAVSGRPVVLYLAPEVDIDAALLKHYGRGSILTARLRELANSLRQLAGGGERLAVLLATAEAETRELAEDDSGLRAELEHLRKDIEAVVSAFSGISDR